MSGEAIKWARLQRIGNSTLKAVVNAIALRADKHGATWVSQSALAQDLGMSDRTLRRQLVVLEALGVITRTRRSKGRHGRASDLTVLSMHRLFNVTDKDLRAVRKNLQPDKYVVPTGQRCPGIIKVKTFEIIQGGKVSEEGSVGTYLNRPALAVVNGSFFSHGGGDEL